MRILSFISVALLGMVFMVSANQVQAREAWDWYASFSAGVVIPQDAEVENGIEVEYDAGYHVEGAVGIHIARYFRLEEAIGWRAYEFDNNNNQDDLRTAVSIMTNFYWDFLGVSNPYQPYLGIGTGVGIWQTDLESADDGDAVAGFIFNTMVGANYHINDNLAFGASYRFTYSNPDDDDGDVFVADVEEFNHSILGTVTLVF